MQEEKDMTKNNQEEESKKESELDVTKEERDQYLNSWKRAQADFINYKNEETKRVQELIKFGNEGILEEMVGVLDNFNRGLESMVRAGNEVDKGMQMIKVQIEELLKKRGVIKIEAKLGDEFNPMYHEAIAMEDERDGLKSGQIIEEVESGYMIHDRVLKPSRVKVVK